MGLNKRLIGAGATASGALTPSENFKVVTWTGNDADGRAIEVGFKPDFVWIKPRTISSSHRLFDSTRGATKFIISDSTGTEQTASNTLQSFSNTGFTVGVSSGVNDSSSTYVAWCWKANGGTTSSNTDGSVTSTVQANQDSGFSIVKYTGAGGVDTIGHGLSAAPEMIIVKSLGHSASWYTYHIGLDGSSPEDYNVRLNEDAARQDSLTYWNDTAPTSTVFTLGTTTGVSKSGTDFIAYCFHSVENFSSFGSYTGNGTTTGPIIETGFEPAFIMIKETSQSNHWNIYDNKRTTTNPRNKQLQANLSDAESTNASIQVDFLSNGFQCKGDGGGLNRNNSNYIYIAFAADPDTEAPTLASSFNIETYTGNGGTQSISGLGFSPSLVWQKERDQAGVNHRWIDTVRGATNAISSSLNVAEFAESTGLTSFDTDGFTVGNNVDYNNNGGAFVSWVWKADDNESTIEEVTEDLNAVAVYKFEDNVNDVTSTYNGTATDITYNSSGKFNKAAVFNGSSSKVAVGNWGLTSNTSFSISMWIKGDDWSGDQYVYGQGANAGNFDAMSIFVRNNSTVYHDNRGNADLITSSLSLSTGQYYHWVHTYNSSTGLHTLYINGSSVGTTTRTLDLQSNNSGGAIGTREIAGSYHFDGEIDQFRVYQQTLTTSNVATLYAETAAQNDSLSLGMTYAASLQSIVSVNANAGMSIVKWTGTGSAGKVPHGLSAAPQMIITKRLNGTGDWYTYHKDLNSGTNPAYNFIKLNSSDAEIVNASSGGSIWNSTSPTATVINVGTTLSGSTSDSYIAYCFHDVSSYQKFGSYSGDGSNKSITGLGFKPDFILFKKTNASQDWLMVDSLRGGQKELVPNNNSAEYTMSNGVSSFDSDGWTMGANNSLNTSGSTYIYWAIAKNVPSNTTLANSFKTITYNGNSSTQSITGAGFKPDFVWIKCRSTAHAHMVADAVRGATKYVMPSESTAELTRTNQIQSFDTDGFTLAGNGDVNGSSKTYVAWCWKAGNTWQSNIDGTIGSTVNANTANGFSIVKYTGTGGIKTVGHGLSQQPELIFIKNRGRNVTGAVYSTTINSTAYLFAGSDGSEAFNASRNDWMNNNTTPTSTVFTVRSYDGSGNDTQNYVGNFTGDTYIAYCFHSVSGYSKISSYSGNGSTQSITGLGFQPDWILIKETSAAESWRVFDSARGATKRLFPDLSNTESTASDSLTAFDSDGFSLGSSAGVNQSGQTYIYMAFKMN